MNLPPIAVALLLSAAAGVAVTGAAMPPQAAPEAFATPAGHRKPADCHRNVRTHRIDGFMIRHRHVGENCAVREVRKGNSF